MKAARSMLNSKGFTEQIPRGSEHGSDREFRINIDSDNKIMKKLRQLNITFPTDESEHPLKRMPTPLLFIIMATYAAEHQ